MKSIFNKDGLKLCRKCGEYKLPRYFPKSKSHYINQKRQVIVRTSPCKKCVTKVQTKRYNNIIKLINWMPERQIQVYKANANKRKILFDLDLDFFKKINKQFCYYCGYIPKECEAMGIDRVVNEMGYIKENCVPCCEICNRAKLQMSDKEYINHCKKVVEKHPLLTNTNPLEKGVS